MKRIKYLAVLTLFFGFMSTGCEEGVVRPCCGGDDDENDPIIIDPPPPPTSDAYPVDSIG